MSYKNIKGTHDLYFQGVDKFQYIENQAIKLAKKYNFKEIRTPIFEYLNVFEKNLGEQTDIINKEMYVFEDKNGEKLVLRPEGTAPVVRSLISNGLSHLLPLKFFYYGPMFRYERPQKGRQRQFHQIGYEYLGTNSYTSDVEIINLAIDFLKALNIFDYKILLNSLGSLDTLNTYKKSLVNYFINYKDKLSQDSQIRLQKNPLRILDSKEEQDKEILKNIPLIYDFFSQQDKEFFASLTQSLDYLGIKYEIDPTLVRGLDYYTHSVFEFVSNNLGAQGTILAGGRYNNLIKNMGGIDTGACGFACGIERLALLIEDVDIHNKGIALISKDLSCDNYALEIAKKIRQDYNFGASYMLGKDFSVKLKKTSPQDYFLVIIIGENELKDNLLSIKDIATSTQYKVEASQLKDFLNQNYINYKIN